MTAATAKPENSVTAWRSPVTSYYLLVAATTILVLVGLAVVLSSSSIPSIKSGSGSAYSGFIVQAIALSAGVVALVVGSRLSIRWWKLLAPWVLLGSAGLLVMVILSGRSVGGNQAWIQIAGFSLQPSEIAKLGLSLYLGVALSVAGKRLTTLKGIIVPSGIIAAVIIGLVLLGHDMGTAMVMVALVGIAYWVAGVPGKFFAWGGLLGVIGVVGLIFLADSRVARILAWANGECADDACWQQTHGIWALASGGLWGLGPGMSREKWSYLPAADNDYIFAIIGEEFGLVGTLLILCAYGMLLIAVTRIVSRSTDRFAQITGAAIGGWLLVQALVNIAVVLKLMPVTGVPLPLVSSGGSSLMASLAAVGVLMALARQEPGAPEAFAARPSVVRRSIAVISKGRRRG